MTMTVAEAFGRVFGESAPVRFSAYDGSSAGAEEEPLRMVLKSKRGLDYVLTAPGSLGLVRAYLQGDLVFDPVDEGDPYELLRFLEDELHPQRPGRNEIPDVARFVKDHRPAIPELPAQETPGSLRRLAIGISHARSRDAHAIRHHYDVSNRFYEMLLGESMAYTCAVYPSGQATLEEAQEEKFDLVCRKLGLAPGMRLLDVGCGWGGMVRHAVLHYGVSALGVTLSRAQADWGSARIAEEGLGRLATIRHGDYRDVTESGVDAVSSIGLTEHIGIAQLASYAAFLAEKLLPQGRLLNHCITRPDDDSPPISKRGFIPRYVFPDGELPGVGRIVRALQAAGLEVRHEENLREHYARTCRAWCDNLDAHWDEAVEEVGLGTARVWALYLAGSRLGFERNEIQLHQVLAVKTVDGVSGFPLRPAY